mgnify:CR=1 FL=1
MMEHSGNELLMQQIISISCVLRVTVKVIETSARRASLKLMPTPSSTPRKLTALNSSISETPGADKNGLENGPTRTRKTGRLKDNNLYETLNLDEASTLSKFTRTTERSG